MDSESRDDLLEEIAERLPRSVFKDSAMEMMLTDDAAGTPAAMRMVAMIEAHRADGDMLGAEAALDDEAVMSIPVPERITRCIAAFKYIHRWKQRRRDARDLQRRSPGRPLGARLQDGRRNPP